MMQRLFTSSIGRSLACALVLFIWATPALATWGFNPLYGPLFFIRGSEVYHDGTTWVEGGAEGSTALIGSGSRIRQTYWFFVDGTNLWLRNPGDTGKPAKVTTPGDYITTTWRNTNGTVRTADRKWLNHYMEHLSINSKGGGRRAPYLMGKGWTNTANNQGPAATATELIALDAKRLPPPNNTDWFNVEYLSSERDGVVVYQYPHGGALLPSNNCLVLVRLSGGTPTPSNIPNMDTPATAFQLASTHYDSHWFAEITSQNTDAVNQGCSASLKDVCWRLPSFATSKEVTASWLMTEHKDLVTLSAWEIDNDNNLVNEKACDGNVLQPKIAFTCEPNKKYVVVADRTGDGWVVIGITWPQ